MSWLVKEDFVDFYKPVLNKTITYWSDATMNQVAFTDCITIEAARRYLTNI